MKNIIVKLLALMLVITVVAAPLSILAEEIKDDTAGAETENKESAGSIEAGNDETANKEDAEAGEGETADKDSTETEKEDKKALKDISYDGEAGEFIEFSSKHFEEACKNATGSSVKYIKIKKLPTVTTGVLYYDYEGDDEAKIKTTEKIFKSDINSVGFYAKKEGTVKIDYEVWYSNTDSLEGTIVIEVDEGEEEEADVISYAVKKGKAVEFDGDDFDDVCDDLTGKGIDYVKFSIPTSTKGTLYYDYDGDDESKVSSSKKYYYDDDPDISDVSFVAKTTGTISISYKGYNTKGTEFSGTVKIKVTASSSDDDEDSWDEDEEEIDDVSYTIYNDETLDFDAEDFEEVCDDAMDEDLYKIVFTTLPSTSSGTLYLGYRSSGKYDEKVAKSKAYYPDDDPDISDITFVPKSSYTGTITLKYKGYYTSSKYYTGRVIIKVKKGSGTSDDWFADENAPSVTLTSKNNTPTLIPASSVGAACKSVTGKTLNFVTFTLPSESAATLWYDYDSSDSSKVKATTKYYLNKKPYLKEISVVPKAGFVGTVTIFYSGEDTQGTEVSGDIRITFEGIKEEVTFKDILKTDWYYENINKVCAAGLMKGNADGTFNPKGEMTFAEAITMVARLYSQNAGDKKDFTANGVIWYQPYIDYAVEKRIIGRYDFENYERKATRGEMAYIFFNSVEIGKLTKINTVIVPDVNEAEMYGKEIYTLYYAGVLTGSDALGTFMKDSAINRAEAATILGRLNNILPRVKK